MFIFFLNDNHIFLLKNNIKWDTCRSHDCRWAISTKSFASTEACARSKGIYFVKFPFPLTSKDITLENKFLLSFCIYLISKHAWCPLSTLYWENRFNSENLFLDKVKNFFYSLCFPRVFTSISWQLHLKTLEYAFKIFLRVHRLLWRLTVGSIYKVTGF